MNFVHIRANAGNGEIVQVSKEKRYIPDDLINKVLKSFNSVLHSEGHTTALEQLEHGGDGRLGNLCRFDRYLMIGRHKVNVGKHYTSVDEGCAVLDVRQSVAFWCC